MKKIKLLIAISVLFISKTSFIGLTFNVGRFITDELAVDVRFTWTTFYEEVDPQTYTTDNRNGAVTGKQFRYINAYPLTTGL